MKMKKMNFNLNNKMMDKESIETFVPSLVRIEYDNNDEMYENFVKIEQLMKTFCHEKLEKNLIEQRELKWKYASIVMDRFFFFISIIYFVVFFIALLFSMPNFFKPT